MTVRSRRRAGIVLALTATVMTTCAAVPATAAPPAPDPGLLPDGTPGAPEPTEQRALCTAVQPFPDGPQVPVAQQTMDFAAVWPLTRGAGQLVAVIDTGVAPHPRLPEPIAGGDYVSDGDGRSDCDAHGTLVAGLIAARPADGSGFAGGAPEAGLIAIRQSSRNFSDRSSGDDEATRNSTGYGDVRTLAAAVRRAADLGATVINISEVACALASDGLADGALGAAVQYATDVKDVVVVAAAGNTDACRASNPGGVDPLHPAADPWDSVVTVASPAWYDDYVLTVGSVEPDGSPSPFALPGPWVDVAAPGSGIVSVDPASDGLTAAYVGTDGPVPIAGTSFAAPLVAATAALVRAYRPELDARAVMDRIERTAHAPAEGWNPRVGHGVVDPLAAVGAPLPTRDDAIPPPRVIAAPTPIPPPDNTSRNVAWIASAVVSGLLVVAALGAAVARRRVRPRAHPPGTSGAGPGSGSMPS